MDEVAKQAKVPKLFGTGGVNVADKWKERLRSYPGRSHGRVETEYETRSKACHEESAEAILPGRFERTSQQS